MGERSSQRGCAFQPCGAVRTVGDFGWEHLDRHQVAKLAVASAEHGAHAAGAGEIEHLVARPDRTLHVVQGGRSHAGRNVGPLAAGRTVPDTPVAMTREASIVCHVLGPARITVRGEDAPPELLLRKHLALLVYLARSPRRGRTRDHVVGVLWSDRDEKRPPDSLSEA